MDVNLIINEIESNENKKRKQVSLAEIDIYNDKIQPHVLSYLSGFYDKTSIKEMAVYSSINLAKRISDQEASLYKDAPKRVFYGLSDNQVKTLESIYKDLKIDQIMLRSNRAFKLQGQNHIQIIPYEKKLLARVLLNHHIDAVPLEYNPEIAEAYILSGFDKTQNLESTDQTNLKIADKNDYKSTIRKYAFWTKDSNFIIDGNGKMLSSDTENPLGMIPIVEVSNFKDFNYWLDRGTALTDFTIQFNSAMTDIAHIVRMQGFAQAWYKGPIDLLPESVIIGPNHVIKLPVDPNNPVETDFGFANPSPDLAGSMQFPQTLLSSFLTSRGLSPKLVSGNGDSERYTSGLDRLLAMIDRFEASQFDMEIYRNAEDKILKIIIRYLNTYAGTDILGYSWKNVKEDDVSIVVDYKKPQSILTDSERLDLIAKKKELGLMSDTEAISEYYGINDEQAAKKLLQINGGNIGTATE